MHYMQQLQVLWVHGGSFQTKERDVALLQLLEVGFGTYLILICSYEASIYFLKSFLRKIIATFLCSSCTSSLGSICFGSLLVAFIQALRTLANSAQNDSEGNNCLVCIAQCILSILESILEYFNKWAFIYVGLYGYGYIEAGRNVMQLFQNRGWEAIIADDLVSNCLALSSLLVAGLTGCCGLILKERVDWYNNQDETSNAASAFV